MNQERWYPLLGQSLTLPKIEEFEKECKFVTLFLVWKFESLPGTWWRLNEYHSMPGRNVTSMFTVAQMGWPNMFHTKDSRRMLPYSKPVKIKSFKAREIFFTFLWFLFLCCFVFSLSIDLVEVSFAIDQRFHLTLSGSFTCSSLNMCCFLFVQFCWTWNMTNDIIPELMQTIRTIVKTILFRVTVSELRGPDCGKFMKALQLERARRKRLTTNQKVWKIFSAWYPSSTEQTTNLN